MTVCAARREPPLLRPQHRDSYYGRFSVHLLGFAVASAVLCCAFDATAQSKGEKPAPAASAEEDEAPTPRVGIGNFEGRGGAKLRVRVINALQNEDVEVVAGEETESIAVDDPEETFSQTAEKHRLHVILVGKAGTKKRKSTLEVKLRGADGEEIATETFEAKSAAALGKLIDDDLGTRLAPLLEKAARAVEKEPEVEQPKAAAEPTPKPEPEAPPVAEAPADAADGGDEEAFGFDEEAAVVQGSLLELLGGVRGFSRSLSYEDAIPEVAEYSLGAAPAVFLQARVYPMAASAGVLGNIGIVGGYEQGFLIKSRVPDGRELESTSRSFFGGLRGRIPLSGHELGLGMAYGQHNFEMVGDEDAPFVPDVDYSFVRASIDGRFRFDRIVAGFHLGRRFVMASGEIESSTWFPHATTGGIDAGVFGGFALSKRLDLLIGLDVQRYFLDLNPNTKDAIVKRGQVAGGAVDQYLSGWAGASFALDGS